ncbi:MAG: Ig-like domain-containing protein [bacterium]
MSKAKILQRLTVICGLIVSFLYSTTIRLEAAEICVQVKLEIPQKVTLEREAFDARLKMINFLALDPLTNIKVDVHITDEEGNPVKIATPDSEDEDALFFMKISNKENIEAIDGTGVIEPAGSAVVHWLIIPTIKSGGTDTTGKTYFAKAHIYYSAGGVDLDFETWEEDFTVKPQPKLVLSYALPGKVYGDNPFTDPVEPPVPFKLAVRVSNVGYGPARNLSIESAQPKIVENVLGLLIDFKLLGCWVNGESKPDELKINFGDIPPNSCKIGMWDMISTISGTFTEMSATFTHSAELGGSLTSLIDRVETYLLVHNIVMDDNGRDSVPDLLVSSTRDKDIPIPDKILGSDNIDTSIKYVGTPTVRSVNGGLEVITPPPESWLYVEVNDPHHNQDKNISIVRADGKVLNSDNYWLASNKVYFVDDGAQTTYYIRYASLDTTPPQTTLIPISPDPISNRTPNFKGTVSDILNNIIEIQYRIDGGVWRNVSGFIPALVVNYNFKTPPLADGLHTVEVRAKDAAGNLEQTAQDSFTVDSTPPFTANHNPSKNAVDIPVNTNIEVHILDATTGVDKASIIMKVNGNVVTPNITGEPSHYILIYDPEVDFNYSQSINVEIVAKDLSNWPNTLEEVYYFVTQLDTDPPDSTIVPLSPELTQDNTPTFTGNAVDVLSKVVEIEYRIDYNDWRDVDPFEPALNVNYCFTTPVLTDGSHTVYVRAKDVVGNQETSYARDEFVVYSPPGTPTITSPTDGAKIGTDSIEVVGTGKLGADFVLYANGSQTTSGTISTGGTWTGTVVLADGSYTLTARVKDWAGNMSAESLGVQIEIDTTAPATPSIISPASGTVMGTNTFEVKGMGEINSWYELYVSGSLTTRGVVSSTWTTTITLTDGAYTLWAIVEDEVGNRSPQSEPVSVIVDTAPPGTPSITSPADGAAINSSDFPVAGIAEANAVYRLYINGNPTVTGTASVKGIWQTQVSLTDGAYTFTTTYQDWAGNTSPESLPIRVEVDTSAPATPIISSPIDGAAINTADLSINGMAEANTTYTLYMNGTSTATGAVLANGIWQTLLTLADGTYSLSVKVRDRAGNTSPQSQPALIEIDTVGPATPTITFPVAGAAIGTLTFGVTGTGESNAMCTVYVNGVSVGTTTVTSAGTWRRMLTLTDGSYTLKSMVEDRAGNPSPQSTMVEVKIDTVPPDIPIITTPANNAVIGTANFEVQGTGEAESTFILYANGSLSATGSVSITGSWQVSITLSDGPYDLTCIVKDKAGNHSPESLPTAIKVETSPPGTPSITLPSEGAVIGTSTIGVAGSAEADTSYTLYVNGSPTITSNVLNNGTWQTTVTLAEGTYSLTVIVEDWVGNQSPQSPQVTVIVDTTPPNPPTITSPKDGELIGITSSFYVDGTAELNTIFNLYVNGSLTAFGSVTSQGKWGGRLTLKDGTYTLMAKVLDMAGNSSSQSPGITIEIDTIPPSGTPTIISPADGEIIKTATFDISGTGESDSFWVLYIDNNLWKSGSCSSNWTETVTLAEGFHTIYYRLRDQAYNYGTRSHEITIQLSIPPGTPTITSPTDGAIINTVPFEVQGTGGSGTTYFLYANDQQVAVGSVSLAGTWTAIINLTDGSYSLTAKLKDASENFSPQSSVVNVQVDTIPPFSSEHNPAPNAVDVPVNTNIIVHIKDAVSGVKQSSIVMKVGGSVVYPFVSGIPQDYTLIYDPPFDFNYSEIVNVTIAASDMATNTFEKTYSFLTEPSPGTQTQVSIYPGWNLIALPLKPLSTYTAKSLASEMDTQGAQVDRIQSWDGSGWKTYLANTPFGDFNIESGKGYFVLNKNYSTWQVTGVPIHTFNFEINPGWNLIGIPVYVVGLIDTAKDMGNDINNQQGVCDRIQSWDGSGWKTYVINLPFGNFGISEGEGYFVYATKSSNYSPNQIKVINLQQTQFTVSWKTAMAVVGEIHYGTTTALGNIIYEHTENYDHQVTITNLEPETIYYYDIICDGVVDDNQGQHYMVTTPQ